MDPRITRTKSSLQQALLELARERNLDAITVADITERAGVNRSSFYQHYADKELLLADALDTAIAEAGIGISDVEAPVSGPPEELAVYLRHIERYAAVYRRVLGDRGSAVVTARVRTRLEEFVREGIGRTDIPGFAGVPIDVAAAGITGSALGVVRAWLEREPLAPTDVAVDWLWRVLLGPGDAWTGGKTDAEPRRRA